MDEAEDNDLLKLVFLLPGQHLRVACAGGVRFKLLQGVEEAREEHKPDTCLVQHPRG
jgi:hypothetical protein